MSGTSRARRSGAMSGSCGKRFRRCCPEGGPIRMKAVLICPGERPAVSALAQSAPLALVPILGKTLLEDWLCHLLDRGLRPVFPLAAHSPGLVRAWLGGRGRLGM